MKDGRKKKQERHMLNYKDAEDETIKTTTRESFKAYIKRASRNKTD